MVAVEVASDRLSDLVATPVDPNTSKGTFSAIINMGMPMRLRQWLSGVNKLLLQ